MNGFSYLKYLSPNGIQTSLVGPVFPFCGVLLEKDLPWPANSTSHVHCFCSGRTHGHWQHFCALGNLTVQASRVTSVSLPLLLFSFSAGVLGHVPYSAMHPRSGQLGTGFPSRPFATTPKCNIMLLDRGWQWIRTYSSPNFTSLSHCPQELCGFNFWRRGELSP